MSILNSIARFANDYRARRRRMNGYLEILALPPEIQKDIGWPVEDDSANRAARDYRSFGG